VTAHGSVWIGLLRPSPVELPQLPPLQAVQAPSPILIPPFRPGSGAPTPPGPPAAHDLDALIRAAFAPSDADAAWCIVRHEDPALDPQAHNPGYPLPDGSRSEDSWGYWQINLLAHTRVTIEQATDPEWSTRYAAALRYNRGNWRDWLNSARACGLEQ